MKNINKQATLFVISIFLLQSLKCQVQNDMTGYLKQKFLAYTSAVPREEIFLQTDRDEYISGEDLWFSVYTIDRQSFKPSLNSRIVYFELLNAVNRPMLQKRILVDKGFGPGQLVLPDTLGTGRYTIRAYTSWMKNFLPYNCFVKEIMIYNALNTSDFKGKLNAGYSIKKGGNVDPDKKYENTGISLGVNNNKQDILELFLNADHKFRAENNNHFYIFIQTNGNINYVSAEKTDQDTTFITIPKGKLDHGINQIMIFNSKGEPVIERLIFTPFNQNNFFIVNSPDSCNLREKIKVEINIGDESANISDLTNLSISVAPGTAGYFGMDINDYLLFGSEYGLLPCNIIKSKSGKEIGSGLMDSILLNIRSNWIDWVKILHEDPSHFKFQMEKEDHFLIGKLATNDQQPVHSSELLLLCTPGKEATFQYSRTDNEGNFSFNLHIDEELKDLVIMPDNLEKKRKIIIESSFSDQYFQSSLSVDSVNNKVPHFVSKWSINYQVKKIFEVPSLGGQSGPVFLPKKATRFYGKPDIGLILADYIRLPVMDEVFFELLPYVSLKKRNSKYEILISDRVDDKPFITTPCLMIDGVIIKDPSLIAQLDPEIVERIDVIKEEYLVGKYFFPGIVNVITGSGDFSCVSLPDYMIRLPYRVLDSAWSFVSPDYSSGENKESRIPDYRNTLYWNPSVRPDKDGIARVEFWSSDNASNYVINIQGITHEGKTLSFKKPLKVK